MYEYFSLSLQNKVFIKKSFLSEQGNMALANVHLTVKGADKETEFFLIQDKDKFYLKTADDTFNKYEIERDNESGIFRLKDYGSFSEAQDEIDSRLIGLSEEWIDVQGQGFDSETGTTDNLVVSPGYGPDDIFVENKPFSLRQMIDLIHSEDIEISPNFQRHFIWDNTRRSRLIESIFLGLPLPSIYLSQYDDGRLTIVDGLQRLSTIKQFYENNLRLSNLEYLKECNGKTYKQLEKTLSPLRMRRFGQTQIMCFVIDYRSPSKLKYDLFRRLNTGGKPLNNQEIRNCLSRPYLQKTLYEMTSSDAFKAATDKSVKSLRMEDQEVALRYMYFFEQYEEKNPVGNYKGNIDSTLDDFVDELNGRNDLNEFKDSFIVGLMNSEKLFGKYAFRKVYGVNYELQKRSQINKLLMTVITVLLSKYADKYQLKINKGVNLTYDLAQIISSDADFFNAITWSTNSKSNMILVYNKLKNLFDDKLI